MVSLAAGCGQLAGMGWRRLAEGQQTSCVEPGAACAGLAAALQLASAMCAGPGLAAGRQGSKIFLCC